MADSTDTSQQHGASGHLAVPRLIIALAQGIALYLLYSAYDAKVWPATDGSWFAPLLLICLFVPLIAIQGAGNIRLKTLIPWAIAASAIVSALAWYSIWRSAPLDLGGGDLSPRVIPAPALVFILVPALFIAHALISGGDADRRFMARYTTHFDVAWKSGLQVALSVAFVGAFWLLLELGAGLFGLIGLSFFRTLIEHEWFAIPATTLAAATALHVTDIRAGLIRGTRTLALVLLSWLLPLSVLLVGGFLASLVFTGLQPLWNTRHASALLLVAAAALVALVNAAYQDGDAERKPVLVLRFAIRAASLLLVPTAALSAIALALRVREYGWTGDRVELAASITAAVGYALGYAASAVEIRSRLIEVWNFGMALVVLALILVIFSPLADPERIAVADQIARLESGKTQPQSFDFAYLRWHGERFGRDALKRLAAGQGMGRQVLVRELAQMTLKPNQVLSVAQNQARAPSNLASRVDVFPKGRALPESFLKNNWGADPALAWGEPSCLNNQTDRCDAFFVDFEQDGHDEIVLLDDQMQQGTVYRFDADGVWRIVGRLSFPTDCFATLRDALRAGRYSLVDRLWRPNDIVVEGTRLDMSEPFGFGPQPTCPKATHAH